MWGSNRFTTNLETIKEAGGTGAVSSEIEQQLKKLVAKTERLSGSNRYETSKLVADRYFGDNASTIMLSYGLNFPDGLCGGPLAAKYGAPLLMAENNSTKFAADYAASVGNDAESIISGSVTLGGTPLISDSTVKKILPEALV